MKKLDATTALFEFGRASFGWLEVTLQSPGGGDTIYVAIGEVMKNGRIDTRSPGTARYHRYPLVLEKGRRTYSVIPAHDPRDTGPQAVRMPYPMNEVAPSRYYQIERYNGDMAIGDVTRHTVIYPFDDDAAHFSSDDSTLDAI